jgi:hypothetical protein
MSLEVLIYLRPISVEEPLRQNLGGMEVNRTLALSETEYKTLRGAKLTKGSSSQTICSKSNVAIKQTAMDISSIF